MRKELFYNPALLAERIGEKMSERRRLSKLKNTAASVLNNDQLASLEFIEMAVKSGNIKTAYDLGANAGTWTLLAKTIIPGLTVHAFEPIPQYQQAYLTTTQKLNNVTLHKAGAGSENKMEKFNISGHSSSFLEVSNHLLGLFPNENKTGELDVQMIRLDDYAQKNNLALPDLMKLDVEGYELEALKGAVKCMENCRYIILEVSFIERHIGQPLFHEVVHFMGQHNFMTYAFPYHMHLAKPIQSTDVLFKNKKFSA